MSVEITAAAMRKLAENIENDSDPSLFKAMKALRQAADALEASQARIAAYECLQQSTQTRVRELEDDNYALKLSLASGGGRLSSGAKIWLQQKERAEQAEARVAVLREALKASARICIADCEHAECERDARLSNLALSTLDPAAERLLAERKILMEAITGIAEWTPGYYDNRDNGEAAALQETAQNALTALREFDDKETK